jgi:two-component system, cell cycle response regulator CtrA
MSELQRALDRIDELEELLGLQVHLPNMFGLTPLEVKIVGLLTKRNIVSRDIIYSALYGSLPDCDQPDPKTIEVHICKVRRKLSAYGLEIKNRYSVGYYIEDDVRSALKDLTKFNSSFIPPLEGLPA